MAPSQNEELQQNMPRPDITAPQRRPRLLAIDASSGQAGIALYDGGALSVRSWPADRTHTATMLREIHHLLDADHCSVADLVAIGLAQGPGAFTGLRVGFGIAKGFHLAAGVPLIGISTLKTAAYPFASCKGQVTAVIAAGRGRLVWARYRGDTKGIEEITPPRNGNIQELVLELRSHCPTIVTGELNDDQEAMLQAIPSIVIPPPALRMRQPGALASLAWNRWQAGDFDDATAVEPVYLSSE